LTGKELIISFFLKAFAGAYSTKKKKAYPEKIMFHDLAFIIQRSDGITILFKIEVSHRFDFNL
jgi:hypothetical protein